jgi:hypothetical protein
MPKLVSKQTLNELLPNRYTQISESHCGPAVIQTLLANVGVIVSQEQITQAAGAGDTIHLDGTRPSQLARAVHALAPSMTFWQKEHGTIEDLRQITQECRFPVGIEWQGLFEVGGFRIEEETGDEDYGHYSIVTHVGDGELIIVDPYKDFANQDRIFTFAEFLPRWWDTNEITDPHTGKKVIKKDEQLLFVITPSTTIFSESIYLDPITL